MFLWTFSKDVLQRLSLYERGATSLLIGGCCQHHLKPVFHQRHKTLLFAESEIVALQFRWIRMLQCCDVFQDCMRSSQFELRWTICSGQYSNMNCWSVNVNNELLFSCLLAACWAACDYIELNACDWTIPEDGLPFIFRTRGECERARDECEWVYKWLTVAGITKWLTVARTPTSSVVPQNENSGLDGKTFHQ